MPCVWGVCVCVSVNKPDSPIKLWAMHDSTHFICLEEVCLILSVSWKDENQGHIWGELGWSRVASACSGLERGLGCQPETEARPQQWEHQTLTTRPVVSDKSPGPSALQERTSLKMESSKARSVCIWRKNSILRVDTHRWIQRGRAEFYSCGNLNYF